MVWQFDSAPAHNKIRERTSLTFDSSSLLFVLLMEPGSKYSQREKIPFGAPSNVFLQNRRAGFDPVLSLPVS